jgi:pantothenate kinase
MPDAGTPDGTTRGAPTLDAAAAVEVARALVPAEGRLLLGLTGPPGAGKSSLADRLVEELGPATAVVPMDGFHLPDARLRELGLADRKGAPETFDREAYVGLLARLRVPGVEVRAPRFDRELEVSVPDEIVVPASARLVVTEGNYLLHWPQVRALLDEIWYVAVADDETRVRALIARHESFGRTPAAARAWVLRSDESNARLVEATGPLADRVVVAW